jgi:hypothetical protein
MKLTPGQKAGRTRRLREAGRKAAATRRRRAAGRKAAKTRIRSRRTQSRGHTHAARCKAALVVIPDSEIVDGSISVS